MYHPTVYVHDWKGVGGFTSLAQQDLGTPHLLIRTHFVSPNCITGIDVVQLPIQTFLQRIVGSNPCMNVHHLKIILAMTTGACAGDELISEAENNEKELLIPSAKCVSIHKTNKINDPTINDIVSFIMPWMKRTVHVVAIPEKPDVRAHHFVIPSSCASPFYAMSIDIQFVYNTLRNETQHQISPMTFPRADYFLEVAMHMLHMRHGEGVLGVNRHKYKQPRRPVPIQFNGEHNDTQAIINACFNRMKSVPLRWYQRDEIVWMASLERLIDTDKPITSLKHSDHLWPYDCSDLYLPPTASNSTDTNAAASAASAAATAITTAETYRSSPIYFHPFSKNLYINQESPARRDVRIRGGALCSDAGNGKTFSIFGLVLFQKKRDLILAAAHKLELLPSQPLQTRTDRKSLHTTLYIVPHQSVAQIRDKGMAFCAHDVDARIVSISTSDDYLHTSYNSIQTSTVVIVSREFLKNTTYYQHCQKLRRMFRDGYKRPVCFNDSTTTPRSYTTESVCANAKKRKVMINTKPLHDFEMRDGCWSLDDFVWRRMVVDEGHEIFAGGGHQSGPSYAKDIMDIHRVYTYYVAGAFPAGNVPSMMGCMDLLQFSINNRPLHEMNEEYVAASYQRVTACLSKESPHYAHAYRARHILETSLGVLVDRFFYMYAFYKTTRNEIDTFGQGQTKKNISKAISVAHVRKKYMSRVILMERTPIEQMYSQLIGEPLVKPYRNCIANAIEIRLYDIGMNPPDSRFEQLITALQKLFFLYYRCFGVYYLTCTMYLAHPARCLERMHIRGRFSNRPCKCYDAETYQTPWQHGRLCWISPEGTVTVRSHLSIARTNLGRGISQEVLTKMDTLNEEKKRVPFTNLTDAMLNLFSKTFDIVNTFHDDGCLRYNKVSKPSNQTQHLVQLSAEYCSSLAASSHLGQDIPLLVDDASVNVHSLDADEVLHEQSRIVLPVFTSTRDEQKLHHSKYIHQTAIEPACMRELLSNHGSYMSAILCSVEAILATSAAPKILIYAETEGIYITQCIKKYLPHVRIRNAGRSVNTLVPAIQAFENHVLPIGERIQVLCISFASASDLISATHAFIVHNYQNKSHADIATMKVTEAQVVARVDRVTQTNAFEVIHFVITDDPLVIQTYLL